MTIRMGVIGAGAISDVHLKALAAHDHVEVACIADPSPEARARQATKYGVGRSVADYREMLERSDLDAVDIAVPHYLHCPMTLDALSAGLHVICEKPMGLDLEEADRMIAAAERSKGRLLIKQYQRCAEHHTTAKEIIDSGELGDVYLVTGLFIAQQSSIENDPDNWRGTWDKAGGGILIDGGVHLVDLMQFMLGRAAAVSATAKRLVADHPHKADDTASLTIEYERGAIGSVVCANCDTSFAELTTDKSFFGTRGSLRVLQDGPLTRLIRSAGGVSEEVLTVENWWEKANVAVMTHLVDCLLDGSEPVVSLEEARHDLEIVLAGYRSANEGRRVAIES